MKINTILWKIDNICENENEDFDEYFVTVSQLRLLSVIFPNLALNPTTIYCNSYKDRLDCNFFIDQFTINTGGFKTYNVNIDILERFTEQAITSEPLGIHNRDVGSRLKQAVGRVEILRK